MYENNRYDALAEVAENVVKEFDAIAFDQLYETEMLDINPHVPYTESSEGEAFERLRSDWKDGQPQARIVVSALRVTYRTLNELLDIVEEDAKNYDGDEWEFEEAAGWARSCLEDRVLVASTIVGSGV